MSSVQEVNTEVRANDLRGRAAPREVRFGAMGKILGAIVVVILAGAVGTYAYETMPPAHPKPVVSNSDLPQLPANPPAQHQ